MWIKLWADPGRGHQNHSEKYLWFDDKPDDEFLEDMWKDWTHTEFMHEHTIGGSEVVERPPIKEIEDMLFDYRAQEGRAKKMIDILESYSITEQPVKETPVMLESGWGFPLLGKKWHYFHNNRISLCGKWMYTGELEDRTGLGGTHNCRACTKKLEKLNKKKEK